MGTITTSLGREVEHCHLHHRPCKLNELSAAGIQRAREKAHRINAAAIELSSPTRRFNCHAFSFAISHGWINYPDLFLEDDYDEVSLSEAQVGDLVIYMNGDTLMHSAQITEVDGSGITELHSKWGELALLSHSVSGVPRVYGDAVFALRRRPTE